MKRTLNYVFMNNIFIVDISPSSWFFLLRIVILHNCIRLAELYLTCVLPSLHDLVKRELSAFSRFYSVWILKRFK